MTLFLVLFTVFHVGALGTLLLLGHFSKMRFEEELRFNVNALNETALSEKQLQHLPF
jgi:hypothetical protein